MYLFLCCVEGEVADIKRRGGLKDRKVVEFFLGLESICAAEEATTLDLALAST